MMIECRDGLIPEYIWIINGADVSPIPTTEGLIYNQKNEDKKILPRALITKEAEQ